VVAGLTPAADPVRKVTIVPHVKALGRHYRTAALEDRYNYSRRDLLARIDAMLHVWFGRVRDRRARAVSRLPLAQEHECSEATAARIDREIEHLIAERQAAVRELLVTARDKLNQVADTLLRDETVEEDTLRKLLGPRVATNAEPVSPAS
jgi:cell division protease FtsH